MITASLILLLAFVVLVWSADKFVYGASGLAKNLGVSPMVIGLTIVAMGSSAPEIMVSANAALAGSTDTSVGNAIGSNITNVLLVLGITALIRSLTVSSTTLFREMPILLVLTLITLWMLHDNVLSFAEGVTLLTGFFLFIGYLFYLAKTGSAADDQLLADTESEIPDNVPTGSAVFWVITGLILLPLSAHFLVENAVVIAQYFGVSELVIGLTIIALGTSLPELAASVAGVLKGEDDLAIGNVIGSNIFNLLAVLGIGAVINPSPIDPAASSRDGLVMLAATVAMILMAMSFSKTRKINRFEGGLLVLGFIGYPVLLFA